jgi:enterochelin esterase-like enzyme
MRVSVRRLRIPAITATTALVAAAALLLGSCGTGRIAAKDDHASAVSERFELPPLVDRTSKPPTGYAVTFRYWGPTATKVQLTGEWSFSSPAHTRTASSQALAPSRWSPGDFPIVNPNTLEGNWPVITMTRDARTGVWSTTVPLPSGLFTYGFYVNCPAPKKARDCKEVPDPSNMPWNTRGKVTTGSVETDSEVLVPSDSAFKTLSYAWQAPNRIHGSLVDVAYPSSATKRVAKANRLAIYTPPGYNPKRAAPYPTLYLSHGYGGNEVDWSTTGDASNILDNLIDSGQVKPMVVVMTNFNGFAETCISNVVAWTADYTRDLIDNVIPFVQARYNVSRGASQRGFAGLSCGGDLASSLLFNHMDEFGYYGIMSPYQNGWTELTPAQTSRVVADIASRRGLFDRVHLFLGGGRQDPIHADAAFELAILERAGIRVVHDFINGGHEWYVWRILLRDFLTQVAFSPATE